MAIINERKWAAAEKMDIDRRVMGDHWSSGTFAYVIVVDYYRGHAVRAVESDGSAWDGPVHVGPTRMANLLHAGAVDCRRGQNVDALSEWMSASGII